MKPSACALYPFQQDNANNCLARAQTIEDTILSSIRAWIVTKKGSRVGNMIGCFLPDILFDLVSIKDLPGMATQLRSDATRQFPGVNFVNVVLKIDTSADVVTLVCDMALVIGNQDQITYLTVTLPSLFSTNQNQ